MQGHIWRTGFEKNELKGVVFDDVPEALMKWHDLGIKVIILIQFVFHINFNHLGWYVYGQGLAGEPLKRLFPISLIQCYNFTIDIFCVAGVHILQR